MMKIAALALVAAANAANVALVDVQPSFEAWTAKFGKTYVDDATFSAKKAVYEDNVAFMDAHNALYAQGHSTFNLGVNEFSDMTHDEFKAMYLGAKIPTRNATNIRKFTTVGADAPADAVDWRAKGAVTPVKNQGQCGSCWSFSTTGSTESINAINGNQLVSLSEQQLMDCSGSYGNQGCNGGLMDSAFKYIIANGGLCSEASYPYTARDGVCKTSCQKVVQLKSYTDVPADNADAFKTAVAQQPVSIAIEADQSSFQFYSGGVMSGNCGKNLDHGVLAVGYGTENGKSFWKVKNSWGASWGMSGYILLDGSASLNGGAGQCGILSSASWPSQ
jgi:C1A family cysteine protease